MLRIKGLFVGIEKGPKLTFKETRLISEKQFKALSLALLLSDPSSMEK